MSDSDLDWFEKDIDKFVVQNQSKKNISHTGTEAIKSINYADGGLFLKMNKLIQTL